MITSKIAKEEHTVVLISKNLLSIIVYSRLRRVEKSQNTNIFKLLNSIFAGRGEKSLIGIDLVLTEAIVVTF